MYLVCRMLCKMYPGSYCSKDTGEDTLDPKWMVAAVDRVKAVDNC
jgi:hypothetical protein